MTKLLMMLMVMVMVMVMLKAMVMAMVRAGCVVEGGDLTKMRLGMICCWTTTSERERIAEDKAFETAAAMPAAASILQ